MEEEVAACQTSFQSRETAVHDISTNAEMDDVFHVILDQKDGSGEQRDIPKEPCDITNISPLPLESFPHSLDVNQGLSQPEATGKRTQKRKGQSFCCLLPKKKEGGEE